MKMIVGIKGKLKSFMIDISKKNALTAKKSREV